MVTKLQALWNHPTGPKTIHFWAPTFKWGLTQAAMVVTGAIWARYSTVITPKPIVYKTLLVHQIKIKACRCDIISPTWIFRAMENSRPQKQSSM